MNGSVISVNVAQPVEVDWVSTGARRPTGSTAIDKRSQPGRLAVGPLGIAGDAQVDAGHGGPDQAVYAYAREDAAFWEAELGRSLPPGRFGENLTTTGVEVSGAVVGERWRVGSTVLEVTTPRTPCATFAGFWGVPQLVKRFAAAGRPGAYLRVVQAGEVGAGDAVELLHRPDHGVTMAQLMAAKVGGDRSQLERIRAVALPEKWQRWLADLDATATG